MCKFTTNMVLQVFKKTLFLCRQIINNNELKMKKVFFLAVTLITISLSSFGNGLHQQQQRGQTVGETHAELTVSGNCGMCKTRIETAAKDIDGVTLADWNVETKKMHLHFDASKTSLDAIGKAIAAVGHDNNLHKADDKVYDALHGCCKYRI